MLSASKKVDSLRTASPCGYRSPIVLQVRWMSRLAMRLDTTFILEEVACSKTILKYITNSSLLREAMDDHDLESSMTPLSSTKRNERNLATDILMGHLKLFAVRRPELKVIIMSSTLDVEAFQSFFQDCTHYNSQF